MQNLVNSQRSTLAKSLAAFDAFKWFLFRVYVSVEETSIKIELIFLYFVETINRIMRFHIQLFSSLIMPQRCQNFLS